MVFRLSCPGHLLLGAEARQEDGDMDDIWTLLVSLGVMWSAPPVSAQDLSR